jgi:hypothetical protein
MIHSPERSCSPTLLEALFLTVEVELSCKAIYLDNLRGTGLTHTSVRLIRGSSKEALGGSVLLASWLKVGKQCFFSTLCQRYATASRHETAGFTTRHLIWLVVTCRVWQ